MHTQKSIPGIDTGQEIDMLCFERLFMARGMSLVAGIDEAGRGCLAGPVVAAAVILPPEFDVPGVTDSKKIPPEKRRVLETAIKEQALSWAVAGIDAATIDRINILQAAMKAMAEAVDRLNPRPDMLLIDGNHSIPHCLPQKSLVRGDSRSLSIAAASIIAKEHRDRIMAEYGKKWPGYGFDRHKGYGTALHKRAISHLGPCPIHRKTFRGVREYVK
jgi:ribonuclease HII